MRESLCLLQIATNVGNNYLIGIDFTTNQNPLPRRLCDMESKTFVYTLDNVIIGHASLRGDLWHHFHSKYSLLVYKHKLQQGKYRNAANITLVFRWLCVEENAYCYTWCHHKRFPNYWPLCGDSAIFFVVKMNMMLRKQLIRRRFGMLWHTCGVPVIIGNAPECIYPFIFGPMMQSFDVFVVVSLNRLLDM